MHTDYLLLRHELKDALVDGESHGRCPGKGADEVKAAIDLEGEVRRGTEKDRCDEVHTNAEDRPAEENEVQAESLHEALAVGGGKLREELEEDEEEERGGGVEERVLLPRGVGEELLAEGVEQDLWVTR